MTSLTQNPKPKSKNVFKYKLEDFPNPQRVRKAL